MTRNNTENQPNVEIMERMNQLIVNSFEIIERDKYRLIPEYVMSKDYPEGRIKYFNKRMFEIKSEIIDATMFGHSWLMGGCREDIHLPTGLDWTYRVVDVNMRNHYTRKTSLYSSIGLDVMWKHFEEFMTDYFFLLHLKSMRDSESCSGAKHLESYFYNVDNDFIEYVKGEMKGKKGISIARIIIALKELGKLKYDNFSEFFKVLQSEAGVKGYRQSIDNKISPYEKLLNNTNPTKKSVDEYLEIFKKQLHKLQ